MELTNEKVLTYRQHIIEQLNQARLMLITRTMEFHEAMNRRLEDPKQVINTNGGPLSITKICIIRLAPVKEQRSHVKTLEKMLTAVSTPAEVKELEKMQKEEAELAKAWSDTELTEPMDISPIDLGGKN